MTKRTIETEAELEAVRAQVGADLGLTVHIGDEVQEVPMVVQVRYEGLSAGVVRDPKTGRFVPCNWLQREVCVPTEQEGQDVPPVVELEKGEGGAV